MWKTGLCCAMNTDVFVLGMKLILIVCVCQVAKLDPKNFEVEVQNERTRGIIPEDNMNFGHGTRSRHTANAILTKKS